MGRVIEAVRSGIENMPLKERRRLATAGTLVALAPAALAAACSSSGGNGEPGISIDCTGHPTSSSSLYKGEQVSSGLVNINAASGKVFYATLGSGTSTLTAADGVSFTVADNGISVASEGNIKSIARPSGDVGLVTALPGTLQTDSSAFVGCSGDLQDAGAKAELNDTNVKTVFSVNPDGTISKLNSDGTTSVVVP